MSPKKVAPFGTWESPITTDIVSGSSLSFSEIHVNAKNGATYLLETRPAEKGRQTIVQVTTVESTELLPAEYHARSQIHEYGGGAATMSPDGNIVFNDVASGGVFSLSPLGEATGVLEGREKFRYGDFDVHPTNTSIILAIQEEHNDSEVVNTLVAIDATTGKAEIIAHGADFYSQPKFSPDGKMVSWLQWSHPDMPWTGSEVHIADWDVGKLGTDIHVAGMAIEESISLPRWHVDGTLLFTSDRTGFWQLYQHDVRTARTKHIAIEGFEDAELGTREFIIGINTYVSLDKEKLLITYTKNATNGLILYNLSTKFAKELTTGLISITSVKKVSSTHVAILGATLTTLAGLYLIDINKPSEKKLLKLSLGVSLPATIFSSAQTISLHRTQGKEPGTITHAIFIPPRNPGFEAPPGSKPPLILFMHGGPTSHVTPGLTLQAQYYTSRGYAYCYPNYAGSTSYGRKYRAELDYSWGVKDCEDTVSCIEYLTAQGLIDGTKVGISGQSSGGYSVLQGMCLFPESFTSGVSHFGISNLKALGEFTHKFESHYLDALLYPPTASEQEKKKIMDERSPCLHAGRIERPLLMLQGDIDMVVPLPQATEMERVLKAKGADVKLVVFEGEGHGFKMRENIKAAIEEEEAMWKRTLL